MFFLNRFSVSCNPFYASFLVTPCLVVAGQPCMAWIPIKKKKKDQNSQPLEIEDQINLTLVIK